MDKERNRKITDVYETTDFFYFRLIYTYISLHFWKQMLNKLRFNSSTRRFNLFRIILSTIALQQASKKIKRVSIFFNSVGLREYEKTNALNSLWILLGIIYYQTLYNIWYLKKGKYTSYVFICTNTSAVWVVFANGPRDWGFNPKSSHAKDSKK